MALDDTDRTLLTALQRDARLTNHELGELLHLSASQAGRRRQALENAGVVQGYRARLHADRVDLSVQAFVQSSLSVLASCGCSLHSVMICPLPHAEISI